MKFIAAVQNNIIFSKADAEFSALLLRTCGVRTVNGKLESAELTTVLTPFVFNLVTLSSNTTTTSSSSRNRNCTLNSNTSDDSVGSGSSTTSRTPNEPVVGGMMTLTCHKKGTITVSRTIDGVVYVAVNGDQTEDKEFLVRKIHVLHRLLEFLCGPHPHFVKGSPVVWNELNSLLDLWVKLYNTDQTFLVEAVEKLHVRKKILEECLKMLDRSLNKLRDASLRRFNYGMFFVHGRLLSMANSPGSNDILPTDMMLLMLWSHYAEATEKDLMTMKCVFLKTYDGHLVQRLLHVIRIYPDIIAVYLSETRNPGFEKRFSKTLIALKQFIEDNNDSVQTDFDEIDLFGQELLSHRNPNVLLMERLAGIREARRTDNQRGLRGLMGGLHDILVRIYTKHILNNPYKEEYMASINTTLFLTRATLRQQLNDYRDFLMAKVQCNITSNTYWNTYPGLVHFLYVKRSTAHDTSLTTPTLTSTDNHAIWDNTFIKEKTWEMVKEMRKQLRQNNTMVMIKEGDFCYTYFIRFKDQDGHHLAEEKELNVRPDWMPVGTIAGDFYLKIMHQCFPSTPVQWIQCLELMCIHISNLPNAYIYNQCERLIESFWQILDSKLPLD